MRIVLLLALLTVGECGSSRVVGWTGHSVTLSCKYDIKQHKELSICWNRGKISYLACNNPLIATGSYKEKEENNVSSRYQLLGRLDDGDVSLTILNLTETDAGQYGCRVEIPGIFNDEKHHFDLTIEEASASTTSSEISTETSTEQTPAAGTAGQMTSADSVPTSLSNRIEDTESSSTLTVVLVSVLFALVALVTAGGLIIMGKRLKQVNKIPQQHGNGTVQFSSTSSTLQLHNRSLAVENIYQIDGGGDGGVYEYCP